MNNKYAGIAIISAGFVILMAIVYFVFFYNFSSTVKVENPNPSANLPATSNKLPAPASQTPAPKAPAKVDNNKTYETKEMGLKRVSMAFAERFGSYSNQSNMENVADLKIFMTEKMQTWADKYVSEQNIKNSGKIYYGLVTKAVIAETKIYNEEEGRAEILVKTQRREAINSTENTSNFQQDIIIKFTKENGAWKVDSAYWQPRN